VKNLLSPKTIAFNDHNLDQSPSLSQRNSLKKGRKLRMLNPQKTTEPLEPFHLQAAQQLQIKMYPADGALPNDQLGMNSQAGHKNLHTKIRTFRSKRVQFLDCCQDEKSVNTQEFGDVSPIKCASSDILEECFSHRKLRP
jgi:hypothetical protein